MAQRLTDQQMLHRQYLQSPVWRAKRQEALAHYGCVCNRCKQHGTDVHHKTYERVGGGELMEDLEVLCRPCHEAHHRAERAASKTKQPNSIHRQAIFRYLTKGQKAKLVADFRLINTNELSFRLSHGEDRRLISVAAQMLGFDSFYGKSRQRRGDSIKPPKRQEEPLGTLVPHSRFHRKLPPVNSSSSTSSISAPERKKEEVIISMKILRQLSNKGISPDAFRARPNYFLAQLLPGSSKG